MPYTYKPRVYTASKLERIQLWQHMREDKDWDFVTWTATWVDKVAAGEELTSTEADFAEHWMQDMRDVQSSDFVLLYGRDPGLRGALVECGMAIAFGLRVVAIDLPIEHSWSYHPSVIRVQNLVVARNYLYQFTIMVPPANKSRRWYNESQSQSD